MGGSPIIKKLITNILFQSEGLLLKFRFNLPCPPCNCTVPRPYCADQRAQAGRIKTCAVYVHMKTPNYGKY